MSLVGYARVSSISQSLDVQLEQLEAIGCEKIFAETGSARAGSARKELAAVLEWVREGDVLVVTRLDRLARSLTDALRVLERLEVKKVRFRALQQEALDTTTSEGRLMLRLLASFAEFENDLRKERQAEGIANAKARGVYKGRPRSVDVAEVQRLKKSGRKPFQIAKDLKISRASVYRALGLTDSHSLHTNEFPDALEAATSARALQE